MSQRIWPDSIRSQIVEACGTRSAAELMRFLMHVRKMRERQFPDDIPQSSRLWVEMSPSRMAEKINYSRSQIHRALQLLVKRGFVVPQHRNGDHGIYQIKSEAIEKWLQPLELFEQGDLSHDATPPVASCDTTCRIERHDLSHDATGLPYMSPLNPIITTNDADEPAEIDSEKEKLIDDCRGLGVSKELTEHLLTVHSRQTLRNGIMYVQKRCSKEKVQNPGGLFNRFCQKPWEHGHERDAQGVWIPSVSIALAKKLTQRVDKPSKQEEICRLPFSRPWLVDNIATNK